MKALAEIQVIPIGVGVSVRKEASTRSYSTRTRSKNRRVCKLQSVRSERSALDNADC